MSEEDQTGVLGLTGKPDESCEMRMTGAAGQQDEVADKRTVGR